MTDQPNTQPENNPQPQGNIQPRGTVNTAGYTPRHEHKNRIKHPTPPWWPTTFAARLALGRRIADAIESIVDELNYNIPNNLVANLRHLVKGIDEEEAWLANNKARTLRLTEDRDFLYNAPSFVGEPHQLIIPKLDPNTVATLGPVDNSREYYSGMLGILIDLEEVLKKSDAYNANQDYGIQLGYITPKTEKPDLSLQTFHITGDLQIDGQPALKWTKGDSDGAVFNYRELGEENTHWHPAGTYISAPCTPAIPLHAKPRVVEIQGRYLKGNHQTGAWSNPYLLTIQAANEQSV
jgi:hypothetical protein